MRALPYFCCVLALCFLTHCNDDGCGGPSAAGDWYWLLDFQGSVKNKSDSSAVTGAFVKINRTYSAQTNAGGYYQTEARSCKESLFDFKTVSVEITKSGFKTYRQDFPTDSLQRQVIGNDLSSDGKQYTLPDIYLSP